LRAETSQFPKPLSYHGRMVRETSSWPEIPYAEWRETCAALHLWSQIAGKYRLAHTPWMNHSWHATLYVTPRGLTTGPIPDPGGTMSLTFDLRDHRLVAEKSDGARGSLPLQAMSVADFFGGVKELIAALGGTPSINGRPNEIPDAVRFAEDTSQRPYDSGAVESFHRSLLSVAGVLSAFRTSFIGKASPVHLFWGSFDLAVTRFSGRPAPVHPGGVPGLPDDVTREAYSHEVSSAGFWPGGGGVDEASFYSYAYPTPDGFGRAGVRPDAAGFNEQLGEFILPYDAVRLARDPAGTLLEFLRSTYEAAATLGRWDRDGTECEMGIPDRPRPTVQR
jgi:Family of unknown function (DUF5996)